MGEFWIHLEWCEEHGIVKWECSQADDDLRAWKKIPPDYYGYREERFYFDCEDGRRLITICSPFPSWEDAEKFLESLRESW